MFWGDVTAMRALGPGSVSSFLKVILDVFYYVLWIAGVIASSVVGIYNSLQWQFSCG